MQLNCLFFFAWVALSCIGWCSSDSDWSVALDRKHCHCILLGKVAVWWYCIFPRMDPSDGGVQPGHCLNSKIVSDLGTAAPSLVFCQIPSRPLSSQRTNTRAAKTSQAAKAVHCSANIDQAVIWPLAACFCLFLNLKMTFCKQRCDPTQ